MQNIPSNTEILKTMETSTEHLKQAKEDPKITRQGERIIEKTEDIIDDLKELINQKNAGDKLQRILKESTRMYEDVTKTSEKWYSMRKDIYQLDTKELRKNLDDLQLNLRTLSIELMRSDSFRRDVYDLFSLLYILFFPDYQSWEAGEEPSKRERKRKKGESGEFRQRPEERTSTSWQREGKWEREGNWERDPTTGNWRLQPLDYRFSDKFSSKEQVVDKFNKVLRQITARPQAQEAFRSLLDVFYLIRNVINDTSKNVEKSFKNIQLNPHFQNILTLFKELLFSMSNYNPDRLSHHFRHFYYSIAYDKEINEFFNDFSEFIKNALKNPERIGTNESKLKIEEFYDRGRKLGKENKKLERHYKKLEDELNKFFRSIQKDTLLVDTKEDINRLIEMLVLDKSGNFVVKPEMINQLKMIFFVTLVQNLRYPLPDIVVDRGDSLQARLRGVVFSVQELLPTKIKARNEGDVVVNLQPFEKKGDLPELSKARQNFKIKLENINFKIPFADIDFSRNNFPSIEDSGKVSIEIGGDGIDLTISLYIDSKLSGEQVFEKDFVECEIHDLNIKLFDTKHDILYNTALSLLTPVFKRNLQNYVEESVERILLDINNFFVQQKGALREGVQRTAEKALKELEFKG